MIWDLSEWLEYNKEKTGQLFKNIVRWPANIATKEMYIVILFEKILQEQFEEPHFGYFRVNVSIKPMTVREDKLEISEKIKFYFWINVAGICQMTNPETGLIDPLF